MKRMFNKIAIVGVGLIGGSIGLAVKSKGLANTVIGIGRRASSIKKAIAKSTIDKGSLDIKRGVKDADLIVIATPVNKVMSKIKEAALYAKQGAIIIDVNSTKQAVAEYADRLIPKGLYFVGTHPLAGLEQSGVLFSSAQMFKDSICVITPTRYTKSAALRKVERFWKQLGAKIAVLSPKRHDERVASISHLPHILSYNLCNAVSHQDLRLAGSGFRDTTRIAKSNPKMWAEIFLQNSRDILRSIKIFEDNLALLKADIRVRRKRELLRRLNAAKRKRDRIG